jgi:hypothetical protein
LTTHPVIVDLLREVDFPLRHVGQADIIRESIDGATMYQLLAAVKGWAGS